MKRVLMVRHGPTHAKAMVGWTNVAADLTDHGALDRLRAHLPQAPVVSSDLHRAVTTADAVQQSRPRLPHDPTLREIHFGDWEFHRWDEVHAKDPARIDAFWSTPGDTRPPGGESWNEILTRVTTTIDQLLASHDTIIAVAHFGAILAQAQRAAGWNARKAFEHKVEPLSVTETIRDGGLWRLERLGEEL